MDSECEEQKEVIDIVFDALTIMFREGGKRYYSEYIYESSNSWRLF
jgi:hypothetical protein